MHLKLIVTGLIFGALTILALGSPNVALAQCCDCGLEEGPLPGDCAIANSGCTAQCYSYPTPSYSTPPGCDCATNSDCGATEYCDGCYCQAGGCFPTCQCGISSCGGGCGGNEFCDGCDCQPNAGGCTPSCGGPYCGQDDGCGGSCSSADDSACDPCAGGLTGSQTCTNACGNTSTANCSGGGGSCTNSDCNGTPCSFNETCVGSGGSCSCEVGSGQYYCSGVNTCPPPPVSDGTTTYRVVCDKPCGTGGNCAPDNTCPIPSGGCVTDADCPPPTLGAASCPPGCNTWNQCGCAEDCTAQCSPSGQCYYDSSICTAPPPPPPSGLGNLNVFGPACASGSYTATFTWSGNASGWQLSVYSDPGFTSILGSKTISGTSTTSTGFSPSLNLVPGTTYFWRIFDGSTYISGPQWTVSYCIPNCRITSFPATIIVGQTGNFITRLTVSNLGLPWDLSGQMFYDFLAGPNLLGPAQPVPGSDDYVTFTWTPGWSDLGSHSIYCRAWNNSYTECRPPSFVTGPPIYNCLGTPYSVSVNVTGVGVSYVTFEDSNNNGALDGVEGNPSGGTPTLSLAQSGNTSITPSSLTAYSGSFTNINPAQLGTLSFNNPGNYVKVTCYTNIPANILSSSGSNCSFNPDPAGSTTIYVAYTNNVSWFNAFDGDVYGLSILDRIPTVAPNNYLINKNPALSGSDAGGAGIAQTSISTVQSGANRTSTQGTPTPPLSSGWEAKSMGVIPLDYFTNLPAMPTTFSGDPFKPSGSILTWPLQPNTSYELTGSAINGPFSDVIYTLPASGGVATLFHQGNLDINDNLTTGLSSDSDRGLVLIVYGDVTIDQAVTEIDAVIISRGTIRIDGVAPVANNFLTVRGGLYSMNQPSLTRARFGTENLTSPAISVYFNPVYLTNTNPDLISSRYSWQELTPQ